VRPFVDENRDADLPEIGSNDDEAADPHLLYANQLEDEELRNRVIDPMEPPLHPSRDVPLPNRRSPHVGSRFYPFPNKEVAVIIGMVTDGPPWSERQIQAMLDTHHLPEFNHDNVPRSVYDVKKYIDMIPSYEMQRVQLGRLVVSKSKKGSRRKRPFGDNAPTVKRQLNLRIPRLQSILQNEFGTTEMT
jgi:hypothetical protein